MHFLFLANASLDLVIEARKEKFDRDPQNGAQRQGGGQRRQDAATLVHAQEGGILVPEQLCHGLLREPHPPSVKNQAVLVFMFVVTHNLCLCPQRSTSVEFYKAGKVVDNYNSSVVSVVILCNNRSRCRTWSQRSNA